MGSGNGIRSPHTMSDVPQDLAEGHQVFICGCLVSSLLVIGHDLKLYFYEPGETLRRPSSSSARKIGRLLRIY